ncbi:oligosaccharide flippase family protein [soil metagenome]
METNSQTGHSYRQIIKGIYTAIGGKGIAVAVNFFAVPLTIHYLGPERYGVWVTLTSILGYLTIFDLGIASTVSNKVVDALAAGDFDSARNRTNAAYVALGAIAAGIGLLVAVVWPSLDWPKLLGDRVQGDAREITLAAACSIIVLLVTFPFSLTPRIMGAGRKVALANYWASAGSVLSFVCVVVATRSQAGLPGLVFSYSGAALLVGIFSTIWIYRHFEWLTPSFSKIQLQDVREMLKTGLPFFAVQISGIVLFQTDNVIIAQLFGAREVTPYAVTWRLFSYASMLQVIALPALWPAYADAFSRRDMIWIRKTYRYNLMVSMGSTAVFTLILLGIGQRFIALWAGPAAVPTFGLVAAMACWTLISTLSWSEGCLLGAAGRVKGQAIYSAVGAVVNLGASIWFGRIFGLTGIIMGTLTAYLTCIIIPQTIEVTRLLREK